jgi:hypothetical protein
MSAISETIFETETHPDGSTLETRTGEKFPGDGFYNRADGFHTVQYVYTNFVGKIKIQATLSIDPQEKDWFSLSETELVIEIDPQDTEPQSIAKNFTGNYVWVRAVIEQWAQGSINKILLSH